MNNRWRCYLVRSIRYREMGHNAKELLWTLPNGLEFDFVHLPVGAMWHSSLHPDPYEDSLCVLLPGKRIWHMHDKGTDGCTWQVVGSPPNVTATPSINYVGTYHGYVREGWITDDLDGRKFNNDGYLEIA